MRIELDSKDLIPPVRLRLLVIWIDQVDKERGISDKEVQDDILKMAKAFKKAGL